MNCIDDPKLVFLCLGKMFLYLIHLLYLFYVKLFSQSEIIFTNDEHKNIEEVYSNFYIIRYI